MKSYIYLVNYENYRNDFCYKILNKAGAIFVPTIIATSIVLADQ